MIELSPNQKNRITAYVNDAKMRDILYPTMFTLDELEDQLKDVHGITQADLKLYAAGDFNANEVHPEARFTLFHLTHPRLFQDLLTFANQAHGVVGDLYAIDALVNRIRWHWDIELRFVGDEKFKFNSYYSPYYSRLLMLTQQDLYEFFRTRAQRRNMTALLEAHWIRFNDQVSAQEQAA